MIKKIEGLVIGFIGLFMISSALAEDVVLCPETVTCKSSDWKSCTFSPAPSVSWEVNSAPITAGTYVFTNVLTLTYPAQVQCSYKNNPNSNYLGAVHVPPPGLMADTSSSNWTTDGVYYRCSSNRGKPVDCPLRY